MNMNCKKTILSAAIVTSLGLAAPVHAQQSETGDQPQETSAAELGTITVLGIRASLQQALQTKRNADAAVEALSAEDLDEFPNTNVAEAMAQIPGVAIDRRFGQGERVSIDGTDPSLNLTFLDGHPVAQAIWLYGEQPNRGFDQTQIASEIIGRIGSSSSTLRRPLRATGSPVAWQVQHAFVKPTAPAAPGRVPIVGRGRISP